LYKTLCTCGLFWAAHQISASGEYQSEVFSLETVSPPLLPCLPQPWQPGQSQSLWDADNAGQELRWSLQPERTKAHRAVAVPTSTMLLTKCVFVRAPRLCECLGATRGGEEGWLLNSRFFDSHSSCKPDEAPLPSVCSFWSGLSGQPVGRAFILLAPPEWVKPLMEGGRERLASPSACSCQSCTPALYQLPANFRI